MQQLSATQMVHVHKIVVGGQHPVISQRAQLLSDVCIWAMCYHFTTNLRKLQLGIGGNKGK